MLSLPAAPEPNPGPQPTPESNVPVTNEPPSLDEVPALPAKAQTNRRQPKDWEQEAYELSETGKYTQGQIAEMLSRQFGCPRVQSQISRAVSRVRAWHGESKQRPNSTRNNQPRPEAVVLGRPPEGAVYVRLPPLGAWSWSGPGFSQAPTEASPLMTNSRLIQCHARVLPNPDQNGKSTLDRSKLFGSPARGRGFSR